MVESCSKKQQPAASLTEDLLVDILSRVPYRSLCRFKCVSRSWLVLCSDPEIRKKSPQTLSGFFHQSFSLYRQRFTNVSGRGQPMVDPSLSFLSTYDSIELIDCCNGLLLCHCQKMSLWLEVDYVVCNPATAKWTVLPDTQGMLETFKFYFCFDPAVSSHFTVFLLWLDELMDVVEEDDEGEVKDAYWYNQITEVEIYSSETGRWTLKQSGWDENIRVGRSSIFFNGALHLATINSSLIMVDTEGNMCRKIPTPYNFSFIGMSQGHLYAGQQNDYQLSIWVLKDYGGEQWDLKHTVNILELFGIHQLSFLGSCFPRVIAIHSECSLIFIVAGEQRNFLSYDMDNRKVHDICALGDHFLDKYLPYIPCF